MRKWILILAGGGFVLLASIAFLYLLGWWIPNFPDVKDYPIRGIDVSAHQGHIDWKQVADSGICFVYLKATEGGDFQDNSFAENLRGAREAGLICGAYHFFRLGTPGREQAMNFIRTVPTDKMTLPPAIDLEFWGNSSARPTPEALNRELRAYIAAIMLTYKHEPTIYAGSDFSGTYFRGGSFGPAWVRDVVLSPTLDGTNSWFIWQFSEKGRVPGINGFVDMDVFNGSVDDFSAAQRNVSTHP